MSEDWNDFDERLDQVERDLYATNPESPGAIIRLDRIEQLLQTMLKVGGVIGSIAVLYKAFEVIGEVLAAKAHAS